MKSHLQTDRREFMKSAIAGTVAYLADLSPLDVKGRERRDDLPIEKQNALEFKEAEGLKGMILQLSPWQDLPPLPIGLAGHFAWWDGDRLLAAGGSYWEAGKKLYVSSVWSYRLRDEIWVNAGKLPQAVCYMVGVAHQRTPYIFGGSTPTSTLKDAYSLKVDHQTRTSKSAPLEDLPVPQECSGGGLIDSNVFITCGAGRFDDPTSYTKDLIALDLSRPEKGWSKGPQFPGVGRCLPATAVCNRSLYVFGGFCYENPETLRNLADSYVYNSDQREWKKIADLPFPLRSAAACSYDDKYILLVGGAGTVPYQPARFNNVLLYEIETNRYSQLRPLPHRVSVPHATIRDGYLYVVGGEPPDGNRVSRVVSSAIHV